jgi:hypothetical protein
MGISNIGGVKISARKPTKAECKYYDNVLDDVWGSPYTGEAETLGVVLEMGEE